MRREQSEAIAILHDAYRELELDMSPYWIAWYFDLWVIIAAKREHWETVARLLAFVDKLRSEKSVPRSAGILPWMSAPMEYLATSITQERLHELFNEGEELTVEDARGLVAEIVS